MKLTLKLVSLLILLIVVSLAMDAWFTLQRERTFLERELQHKAYRIGDSLRHLIANGWQNGGPEHAMALIAAANTQDQSLSIRWVWLDTPVDDSFAPHADSKQLQTLMSQDVVHLQLDDGRGHQMLYTYVSVVVGSGRPAAIELSEPMQSIDDFTHASIQRQFVLAGAILLGGCGITILIGISLLGAPLQRLTEKARRVGHGDLSGPVEVRGHDELSELAVTLNEMCDNLSQSRNRVREESEARIAAIEQLRHTDRLQTVGQLASGVAHELGTPLNVVSGRAGMISSGRLSEDDIRQSAQIIQDQTDRMTKIIRQLLDFSRRSPSEKTDVEFRSLAADTVEVLLPLARKHRVELSLLPCNEAFHVQADAGQMQQVLTNLIVNAMQATPDGGRVTVRILQQVVVPPGEDKSNQAPHLCIVVEDTGEGIPEEIRKRLFEPFFTTKQVGDGTGLGLSIAYGIMQEHGGWIEVDSVVGKGTRFRVFLPETVTEPSDSATVQTPETESLSQGNNEI